MTIASVTFRKKYSWGPGEWETEAYFNGVTEKEMRKIVHEQSEREEFMNDHYRGVQFKKVKS